MKEKGCAAAFFPVSYTHLQEAASTETAGAISSVDDIVGKKIGVQLGTTGDIYVSDYESDGSGTTVESYNKGADAVRCV